MSLSSSPHFTLPTHTQKVLVSPMSQVIWCNNARAVGTCLFQPKRQEYSTSSKLVRTTGRVPMSRKKARFSYTAKLRPVELSRPLPTPRRATQSRPQTPRWLKSTTPLGALSVHSKSTKRTWAPKYFKSLRVDAIPYFTTGGLNTFPLSFSFATPLPGKFLTESEIIRGQKMHLLKSRSKISQFDQLSTLLGTEPYNPGLKSLSSPVSEGLRYLLPVVAQVPTWVTRPTPPTGLQLQFPNAAKFFNYVYTTIGTTLEDDRARNKLRNQQRRLLSNIAGHARRWEDLTSTTSELNFLLGSTKLRVWSFYEVQLGVDQVWSDSSEIRVFEDLSALRSRVASVTQPCTSLTVSSLWSDASMPYLTKASFRSTKSWGTVIKSQASTSLPIRGGLIRRALPRPSRIMHAKPALHLRSFFRFWPDHKSRWRYRRIRQKYLVKRRQQRRLRHKRRRGWRIRRKNTKLRSSRRPLGSARTTRLAQRWVRSLPKSLEPRPTYKATSPNNFLYPSTRLRRSGTSQQALRVRTPLTKAALSPKALRKLSRRKRKSRRRKRKKLKRYLRRTIYSYLKEKFRHLPLRSRRRRLLTPKSSSNLRRKKQSYIRRYRRRWSIRNSRKLRRYPRRLPHRRFHRACRRVSQRLSWRLMHTTIKTQTTTKKSPQRKSKKERVRLSKDRKVLREKIQQYRLQTRKYSKTIGIIPVTRLSRRLWNKRRAFLKMPTKSFELPSKGILKNLKLPTSTRRLRKILRRRGLKTRLRNRKSKLTLLWESLPVLSRAEFRQPLLLRHALRPLTKKFLLSFQVVLVQKVKIRNSSKKLKKAVFSSIQPVDPPLLSSRVARPGYMPRAFIKKLRPKPWRSSTEQWLQSPLSCKNTFNSMLSCLQKQSPPQTPFSKKKNPRSLTSQLPQMSNKQLRRTQINDLRPFNIATRAATRAALKEVHNTTLKLLRGQKRLRKALKHLRQQKGRATVHIVRRIKSAVIKEVGQRRNSVTALVGMAIVAAVVKSVVSLLVKRPTPAAYKIPKQFTTQLWTFQRKRRGVKLAAKEALRPVFSLARLNKDYGSPRLMRRQAWRHTRYRYRRLRRRRSWRLLRLKRERSRLATRRHKKFNNRQLRYKLLRNYRYFSGRKLLSNRSEGRTKKRTWQRYGPHPAQLHTHLGSHYRFLSDPAMESSWRTSSRSLPLIATPKNAITQVKLKQDIASSITITSPVSLDAVSAFWGGGELIKYLLLLPLIQGSQHLPQNPTIEDSIVSPFFNLALKQAVLPLQNQFKSYCFGPKLARLESTNLWSVPSSRRVLRKFILRIQALDYFYAHVDMWSHKTLVSFVESITGKKTALYIGPFIEDSLTFADRARCRMWLTRIETWDGKLGHKIFAGEALVLVAAALRLKDPTFLANWLRGMLRRISFWRYLNIFHYLVFVLRHLFRFCFQELHFKGVKIRISGKIQVAGNARSKVHYFRVGNTGNSTHSNKVAYDLSYVGTHTGAMGLKLLFFY